MADVYLNEFTPVTGSRAFRHGFAAAHEAHRALLSALPNEADGTPPRQSHGVLWQMGTTGIGRGTALSTAPIPVSIQQYQARLLADVEEHR